MDKYLILEFKNAKFFPYIKPKSDKMKGLNGKITDITGRRDREAKDIFKEPITVNQVSNMLHVLFGERPVPTFRTCFYDRVEYLFEKAGESYLKINTAKGIDRYTKEEAYPIEKMQTNKSAWNAWSTQKIFTWSRIKAYLGETLYNEFLVLLDKEFNYSPDNVSLGNIIGKLKTSDNENLVLFFQKLKANKKTGLVTDIKEGKLEINRYCEFSKHDKEVDKFSQVLLHTLKGITNVSVISGEILVPITDEDIEKIKQGSGCARILDGGMITIKGIKTANTLSVHGFTKVKDISLKTYAD